MKITLSVIKADTGSVGGHNRPSDAMIEKAKQEVAKGIRKKLLIDGVVTYTGDDIALTMTHKRGVDNSDIHKFAWDTFVATTKIAKSQGLYGAGQDLLKDAFSGNVKGAISIEGQLISRYEEERKAYLFDLVINTTNEIERNIYNKKVGDNFPQ